MIRRSQCSSRSCEETEKVRDTTPAKTRFDFAAGVPVRVSLDALPSPPFDQQEQTNNLRPIEDPRAQPPSETCSKTRKHAMSNLPRSQPSTNSRLSTVPSQKPRQLSHLQAQLAQLTANMADLESLMRMTAGQAQDMRGLGGYAGAM
jgi:hypothetical protein